MILRNYDLFLFFYITKNPPAQEKEVSKEPAQGLSRLCIDRQNISAV